MADTTTTLIGNLTREPELRFTPSGKAVANAGIAVNRRWQNRQTNEWEESTSFFDVVAWDSLATNLVDLPKGTRVVIYGRLEQRSWEQEGEDGAEPIKRSKVEVVAEEIGASVRWATVVVTKNAKPEQAGEPVPAGTTAGGEEF